MKFARKLPRFSRRGLKLESLEPRLTLDGAVVFNEIQYHPAGAGGELEWIELHNQMTINMDISGWRVAGGVNFEIPSGTVIPGRGYLVIAQNPTAFQASTGIGGALGPWTGSLDNDGEQLRLLNNSDREVNAVEYGDDSPWPVAPDGSGATLAKRSRDLASDLPENWTTSGQLGGTPGAANFPDANAVPITTTIVAGDATWRYNDAGVDQQTAWREPGFNANAWSSGTAPLSAGTPVAPDSLSGLALWLDAGASHVVKDASNRVSMWNDATDATNNTVAQNVAQAAATQQPLWVPSAIGGKPALRFDGVDDLLNNTVDNLLVPGTDRTIIVVGDANDAGEGGSLVTLRRTGAVFNAQIAGTTTYVYTDGQVVNITAPNLLPIIRNPFASVHRVASGTLTLDVNGETKTSGTIQRPENGATGFTIGNREDHPSQRWNGDIAEVIIYNRNLSTTELLQINAYLSQKYGLTGASIPQLALGPTTDYFRHEFQFNGNPSLAELRFLTTVDDGAVFYLNGQEVYRQNMPAGVVTYNTLASSSVGQPQSSPAITIPAGILHAGTNTLAVEVHQATVADPDALFGFSMTVTISPPPAISAPALVINEVAAATDPQFFVELSNQGAQPINLGVYQIVSSGAAAPVYTLPAQMLAPGAQLAVTAAQLGYTPVEGDRLFLISPSQSLAADAVIVKNQLRGRSSQNEGRWLYPDVATPGAANHFVLHNEIVINEIMYQHRPSPAFPGTPPTFETTTLIPIGATWKYNREGANLGATWYQTNYTVDNAIWRSGPGPLGVETNGVLPLDIVTRFSPYVSSTRTYYFQKEFTYTGAPAGSVLQFRHLVDDGAIFYLNGAEIPGTRFMLPATGVDATTLAAPGIDNATYSSYMDLPLNLLNDGNNVLSVEVHQNSAISSDVVFGLELVLTRQTDPGVPGQPQRENPEEWIELFNRTAAPVDISGWTLDKAVQYTFPPNTVIGAGQYLVIAENAATLADKYPAISISGSYSGSLSNSNEQISLRDLSGNPADEVHYYDGGYWPDAADGMGSSLELRDPDSDNSRAESWAASDESSRNAWQTITYTGIAQASSIGPDNQWSEFILGLLDEGEMLIDDIHVIQTPNGTPVELLQNTNFENDLPNAKPAAWRVLGTHGSHGQSVVIVDPDNPTNHVLRLVATGASEQLFNHIETTLKNGASFATIQNGTEYRISFRAKPISGSTQVNTRLYFNRLARTNVLVVPDQVGTPGAANSRLVSNAGPTYQGFAHAPLVPLAGEPVNVSVMASDPDGVATMTLRYSVAGGAWNSAPMTLSNGKYSGAIPGQASASVVQFYVEGVDGLGASSTYPASGQNSRALLRVHDGAPDTSPLDDFRLIMTAADATYLHQPTNALSNDLLGATVIYRGQAFYDIGVRLKGSERGRGLEARFGYSLRFHADDLFRGEYDRLAVDRSSPSGVSSQEVLVKYAANRAGGLPGPYDDLAYLIAPRSQQTGDTTLVFDRYGDEFLDTQYNGGSDGTLFELELVYYPTSTVDGNRESLKVPYPAPDNVVGISSIGDMGDDKERYRHTYLIHNNRDADDYSRIMAMAKAFSLGGQAFQNAVPNVIDVDEFLRAYALENLFGVADTYVTGGLAHNAMFYARPEDGRVLLFPQDMDFAFANSSTGGLVQNGDLQEMIALPGYAHAYYGHLHDIITTTFNAAYVSTWVAYFDSLLSESFAGQGSFINTRSSSVLSQLNSTVPNVAFNITTPDTTVNSTVATIAGTGWINVREIRQAGVPDALPITWNTVTGWQVTVPVAFGTQEVVLQAYDFQGKLITADAVNITSTVSSRPLQDFLRVTEMMYHPGDPTVAEAAAGYTNSDDFEYIELRNTSATTPVDLSGARFVTGIDFDFAGGDVTNLAPGAYVLVVANRPAFEFRYGTSLPVAGAYSGQLNNAGEDVRIEDTFGVVIQEFIYDDTGPGWHPTTDGDGYSLVIIDQAGDLLSWNDGVSWRPSGALGGSPGADDSIQVDGDVNGDLRVDLTDLAILQSHFGIVSGALRGEGDLDGDGAINRADAAILARNYGRPAPGGSPAAPSAVVTRKTIVAESTLPANAVPVRRPLEAKRRAPLDRRAADLVLDEANETRDSKPVDQSTSALAARRRLATSAAEAVSLTRRAR